MNQSIIYILFGLLFATVNGAKFHECTANQQSQLNSAIPAAQSYASDAAIYMDSLKHGTLRYVLWFGYSTPSRRSTVTGHFNQITGNDFASYTYDCTCTESDVFAHVNPDKFGYIYLCGKFWHAPTTGTDSKAGKIISMASQFTANGGTKTSADGQDKCKKLAKSSPDEATNNADSHEYFAENNRPYP